MKYIVLTMLVIMLIKEYYWYVTNILQIYYKKTLVLKTKEKWGIINIEYENERFVKWKKEF